jgi:hypothetical protein
MSSERNRDCLVRLLHELGALPRESERVAFHSGRYCMGASWRDPQADALHAYLRLDPRDGQA